MVPIVFGPRTRDPENWVTRPVASLINGTWWWWCFVRVLDGHQLRHLRHRINFWFRRTGPKRLVQITESFQNGLFGSERIGHQIGFNAGYNIVWWFWYLISSSLLKIVSLVHCWICQYQRHRQRVNARYWGRLSVVFASHQPNSSTGTTTPVELSCVWYERQGQNEINGLGFKHLAWSRFTCDAVGPWCRTKRWHWLTRYPADDQRRSCACTGNVRRDCEWGVPWKNRYKYVWQYRENTTLIHSRLDNGVVGLGNQALSQWKVYANNG